MGFGKLVWVGELRLVERDELCHVRDGLEGRAREEGVGGE